MREGLPSNIFGLQTGRCRSLSFPEDEHEGNNMFKRNPQTTGVEALLWCFCMDVDVGYLKLAHSTFIFSWHFGGSLFKRHMPLTRSPQVSKSIEEFHLDKLSSSTSVALVILTKRIHQKWVSYGLRKPVNLSNTFHPLRLGGNVMAWLYADDP